MGDTPDVSYGTHAKFINLLVRAYHNDGQAMYDLTIDGQTLAYLNVDEYISDILIFDSKGKLTKQKSITEDGNKKVPKFSEVELRNLMQNTPDAAYLMFRIRHSVWNEGGTGLTPARAPKKPGSTKMIDPTKRENWYDLQTQEILPARPDIIKM